MMLVGCVTLLLLGLSSVGGLSALHETIPPGLTPAEYEGFWHMKRPPDDPDYP